MKRSRPIPNKLRDFVWLRGQGKWQYQNRQTGIEEKTQIIICRGCAKWVQNKEFPPVTEALLSLLSFFLTHREKIRNKPE